MLPTMHGFPPFAGVFLLGKNMGEMADWAFDQAMIQETLGDEFYTCDDDHDTPVCPFCGKRAVLQPDSFVYGKSYGGNSWVCSRFPNCDAYVGCHPGTAIPLGTLANKELRLWRNAAHRAFDPIWQKAGVTRKAAYQHLANALHIDVNKCHIGMFNREMCEKVIEVSKYTLLYIKLEKEGW